MFLYTDLDRLIASTAVDILENFKYTIQQNYVEEGLSWFEENKQRMLDEISVSGSDIEQLELKWQQECEEGIVGSFSHPARIGPVDNIEGAPSRIILMPTEDGMQVMQDGEVVGVVDPNTGELISGENPALCNYIERAMYSVELEPVFQQMDQEQQSSIVSSINDTANAMFTIQGGNATYVGQDGSGRALFLTAAHCVNLSSVVVLLTSVAGKQITGEVIFSEQENPIGGSDIAIIAVSGDDAEWLNQNVAPVKIAETQPQQNDTCVLLSPYWREADVGIFEREENRAYVWSGADKDRYGFSGCAAIVNGELCGVHSARSSRWNWMDVSWQTIVALMQSLGLNQPGLDRVSITDIGITSA